MQQEDAETNCREEKYFAFLPILIFLPVMPETNLGGSDNTNSTEFSLSHQITILQELSVLTALI